MVQLMTKGLPRSLSRTGLFTLLRRIEGRFTGQRMQMAVDGASGRGFGSLQIATIPAGASVVVFSQLVVSATAPMGPDVSEDWQGQMAFGTAPNTGMGLNGDEQNVLAAFDVGPAVGWTTPAIPRIGAPNEEDQTDLEVPIYLNLLVDNSDISADGLTFTLAGFFSVSFLFV